MRGPDHERRPGRNEPQRDHERQDPDSIRERPRHRRRRGGRIFPSQQPVCNCRGHKGGGQVQPGLGSRHGGDGMVGRDEPGRGNLSGAIRRLKACSPWSQNGEDDRAQRNGGEDAGVPVLQQREHQRGDNADEDPRAKGNERVPERGSRVPEKTNHPKDGADKGADDRPRQNSRHNGWNMQRGRIRSRRRKGNQPKGSISEHNRHSAQHAGDGHILRGQTKTPP